MASTQRGTRRRSGDELEEVVSRPKKKQRTGNEDQGSYAQRGAASARFKKPGYEEEHEGFNFSRKPKPPPEQPASPVSHAKSTARGRKSGQGVNGMRAKPVRRSARLSGESADAAPTNDAPEKSDGDRGRRGKAHSPSKAAVPAAAHGIHVEKKRRTTKIELPFADTPVINRNREMRQTSYENRRRSSSSMRGRRASSLIDSGTSNAVPHAEVSGKEFYKHIAVEMPEPRRMRQLLMWCGSRALNERPTGPAEDLSALLAARTIQEELLKDFSEKSEMTDWFSRREDIPTPIIVRRPNPRNQENAARLQELVQEVERLEAQKARWTSLLQDLPKSIKAASTKHTSATQPAKLETLDRTLLRETQQEQHLEMLSRGSNVAVTAQARVQKAVSGLEFNVDTLHHGVHKFEGFSRVLNDSSDRVLQTAADLLEAKDRAKLEESGTEHVGVRDVMKLLSRAS